MNRDYLAALALICPTCRAAGRGDQPLALAHAALEDRGDIVEGALQCAHPSCLREHPIVDGIPIVVADFAAWSRHQLDAVLRRRDLTPFTTSLLGDAAGPGTVLDDARRNASIYGAAHYGAAHDEGGFVDVVRAALALAPPPPALALDLGCSVGRGTFELAAAGAEVAVGIDLDFAMLQIAARARARGVARYERRRSGVVYEPRETAVPHAAETRAGTAFVCADATNLPFAAGRAAHALALNVVDCVPDPAKLLAELARVLAPAASAVVASPYDWTPTATPVAAWLGGHSQRGELAGAPEANLRAALPQLGLALVSDHTNVPWRLRVHDRATMEYSVHVVHVRRA
jgi:SAM-dependent methyltransferase|nr:methyltransferase domain-containing protein [Kofleriaceae bacterium]